MTAFGEYADDGTASTMKMRDYKDATDLVAQPIAFPWQLGGMMQMPIDKNLSGSLIKNQTMAVAFGGDIARSLTARHDSSPCADRGMDVVAVAQPYIGGVDYENNAHGMDEATGPLLKGSPTGGGRPLPAIATAMQVRRLLPEECEKLQGFLPGYTAVPWRNKQADECPDGPRYKALGNSMAVPVMRWIGERINQVEEI